MAAALLAWWPGDASGLKRREFVAESISTANQTGSTLPPAHPHSRRIPLKLLAVTLLLALSGTGPLAAARAGTVTSALSQATGHSATQLGVRAVCGLARPGRASCLALVLTLKGDGRPVALRERVRARPMRVARSVTVAPAAAASASVPQAFTAAYLQWAYDTTWLSADRGASDTVAIVDAYGDPSAYSDMEAFRAANGLPPQPQCSASVTTGCFELVNQYGQTSPLPGNTTDETGSWNIEESLDIDAVSSLCPLCKILVVEANSDDSTGSPDLQTAVQTAANLAANQISLSWGTVSPPGAVHYASPYNTISSASILAAAGDSAYPGSGRVQYPAALSDVTAVGGTSLAADATVPRGFDETAWSVSTCATGPCGTGSGCDISQAIPAYQQGLATECAGRAYNDISADGDPNSGLAIYDSQPGSEGCGTANDWCIVGGTSLATPLTAAFEAITGIGAGTPAWAYADAPLLNAIVSGTDGSCLAGQLTICNAGPGWDGPTGNGSISGDLVAGGPGIGASDSSGVNANDVTLTGGVYPNGLATTYSWKYWPAADAAASAQMAAAGVAGSGVQAVSATLCGELQPGTTYDFALTANNASGTVDGYTSSFTTPATESAPVASSAPTISGSAQVGQTLGAQNAAWIDSSCNSSPVYAWQQAPGSGGPWTTVASGVSFQPTVAQAGEYLRLEATESNAAGYTTAVSVPVGPVSTQQSAGGASSGGTTFSASTGTGTGSSSAGSGTTSSSGSATSSVAAGGAPNARTQTVRRTLAYRCALTCKRLPAGVAASFRTLRADYGRYVKLVTRVTSTLGARREVRTNVAWVGPIAAPTAGYLRLADLARVAKGRSTVIRGAGGRPLARVRVIGTSHRHVRLAIRATRGGATVMWAYVLHRRTVVRSTRNYMLRHPLVLALVLGRGQTLVLVSARGRVP